MLDKMGGKGLCWARLAASTGWRAGRAARVFGSLALAFMFSGCAAAAVGLPIAWDVVTTTIGSVQRKTANESLQAANEQLRRTLQALENLRLALDPEYRMERAKMERRRSEWLAVAFETPKMERRRTEWLAVAVETPQAPPAADQPSDPGPVVARLEQSP